MSSYYESCAIPKPEPRKKTKARKARLKSDHIALTRAYVFGRERDLCRCCRIRAAHSMHELIPRSLGGKVSRTNSIAVCGSGTTLCHGHLQRREIQWLADDPKRGAEGTLVFWPVTVKAANWVRVTLHQQVVSPPMIETEQP